MPPVWARYLRGSAFRRFWFSQLVSSLGDAFSGFALPLLVYHATGSALNLALSTAIGILPYLLFGLLIGVWVDRVDRRRLMISLDLSRAIVIATVPLLGATGFFALWYVYLVQFVMATLGIGYAAAQVATLPSLVERTALVAANGRLIAAYSAASIFGPLLAGGLAAQVPLPLLLLVDASSFLVAAVGLSTIHQRFDPASQRAVHSQWQDLRDGLRYVWVQRTIRALTLLVLVLNALGPTVRVQLVVFAQHHLGATDAQIGLFASAAGAAVLLTSLLAGRLSQRWQPGRILLTALIGNGALVVALGQTTIVPLAVLLWALQSGLGALVDIAGMSLRQSIVPTDLLGRVTTVSRTVGFIAIPLNALIGGVIIDRLSMIGLVYSAIGGLTIIVGIIFSFSTLGRRAHISFMHR